MQSLLSRLVSMSFPSPAQPLGEIISFTAFIIHRALLGKEGQEWMRWEVRWQKEGKALRGIYRRVGLWQCVGQINASVARRQVSVHLTDECTASWNNHEIAPFGKPISYTQPPLRQLQWKKRNKALYGCPLHCLLKQLPANMTTWL